MKLLRTIFCTTGLVCLLSGSLMADLLALYEGEVINTPNPKVALDSSGNGNHGLLQIDGEIELGAGKTGNALGFPDTGGTTMKVNPAGFGAFDAIADNQSLTVGFWMAAEESAGAPGGPGDPPDPAEIGPRNQSVFWAVGIPGETDRAFQSHVPWSNSNVYFDVGGCCDATSQRVNGVIERELWDSKAGDEWTFWTYTIDADFGDAYVYANGEEVLYREGPTSVIPELAELWIGSAPNAGNRFSGRLDDFFIADEALSLEDINTIMEDGAKAFFGTQDPEEYVPTVEVNADLDILDGKLAGSVSVTGAEVGSWSVDEVIRIEAGGTEVVSFVSLAGAGVAGDGTTIGDTIAALGDVPLVMNGVDREFRLNLDLINSDDPVFGATFSTSVMETIDLGDPVGGIPPLVLLGDIDQNGEVGFGDFLILSGNYGATGAAAAGIVPEPSSASLALISCLGMLAVCRRRSR